MKTRKFLRLYYLILNSGKERNILNPLNEFGILKLLNIKINELPPLSQTNGSQTIFVYINLKKTM